MNQTTQTDGVRAAISVFLAHDNLIVREGVRAVLDLEPAQVKGRDAPVRAYKVSAVRRAETGVGA